MKKFLILLILLIPFLLFAQGGTKTLIKAGKFFNSETGIFQSDIAIIVSNNKIEIVKLYKEVSEKEKIDCKIIDLSKYTILPGLIDAHTHLLNKETILPENKYLGLDMMKTLTMVGDAYRAIYGSVKAKAYLEAGITAVQDLGNAGQFADIALRKSINEGLIIGPRMRCAGMALASEGGTIPKIIYKHRAIISDEYRIVNGPEDATQAVREVITQGADVIKIYSNNTVNITALSIEEMKAIVNEAHRYGIRVTAHSTSNQATYNAVISGVDGIEHGDQIQDSTFKLMAKKGVIFVATHMDDLTSKKYFQLAYPDRWESILKFAKETKRKSIQSAIKNGVIIAAGSDDNMDLKIPFAEVSKRTLISYYESEMTIPEILKTATINASRQLNWSDEIGIIKPGYLADIIAVDNDLDKNINAILNVHFVMKDGKVYVNN
jgi:imidazolonepropionase-like amidohydrolase